MVHEERKAEGKVALEASGVRKIYRKDGREMPVLDVERYFAFAFSFFVDHPWPERSNFTPASSSFFSK